MENVKLRGSALCAIALLVTVTAHAQTPFAITIERKYQGTDCTSGYLAINGIAKMHAIERPWQNNATNLSSIPVGKYKGTLRYDHNDLWRIELVGVPNRPNIQIHIGNTPADTKGCILVGMGLMQNQVCHLTQSLDAYKALKKAFYGTGNPVSTPNKEGSVEIKD